MPSKHASDSEPQREPLPEEQIARRCDLDADRFWRFLSLLDQGNKYLIEDEDGEH